ncbi:TPA: hypothetical protein L3430_005699 [Escherichia coli]|nr:hypothetical protein [Escherichia coli]
MRDDRFNALKQEFDGAPEHEADALLGVADMIKAAFFLINTSGYRSEGAEILNIASALITLLEPVIMELQEIDLLHDRYKEQDTGK